MQKQWALAWVNSYTYERAASLLVLVVAVCSSFLDATCGSVLAKDHQSTSKTQQSVLDPELAGIKKQIDSSDLAGAEKRVIAYISKHPDSNAARLLYAELLYQQKRYFACIDESNKVVASDPNSESAWHHLGNCYQQVHKPDKALEAYKRFVSLSKEPQPQYQTLIQLLEQQGKDATTSNYVVGENYLPAITQNGLFRWSHTNPITVYIQSGDGVPEFRPEFEESLRQAFEDWSEASGHHFSFAIQEQKDHPDISVSWTNDLHAPVLTAEAGDCNLQSGPNGLSNATVRLLTVDPFKQAPLGKEALHAVCLHEIGHALGLQGHSGIEGDIMFPILHEDSISPRDAHTLFALYAPDLQSSSELRPVDGYGRALPKAALAERLVNDGSTAAVAGDDKRGLELLEQALAIDPSSKLARSNLAVCANNLAISPDHSEEESMKLLYEALFWLPDYEASKANLKNFYMNDAASATDFATHATRAERRLAKGDVRGAIVEYRWALAIKNDPLTRNKLTDCEHRLASSR